MKAVAETDLLFLQETRTCQYSLTDAAAAAAAAAAVVADLKRQTDYSAGVVAAADWKYRIYYFAEAFVAAALDSRTCCFAEVVAAAAALILPDPPQSVVEFALTRRWNSSALAPELPYCSPPSSRIDCFEVLTRKG